MEGASVSLIAFHLPFPLPSLTPASAVLSGAPTAGRKGRLQRGNICTTLEIRHLSSKSLLFWKCAVLWSPGTMPPSLAHPALRRSYPFFCGFAFFGVGNPDAWRPLQKPIDKILPATVVVELIESLQGFKYWVSNFLKKTGGHSLSNVTLIIVFLLLG